MDLCRCGNRVARLIRVDRARTQLGDRNFCLFRTDSTRKGTFAGYLDSETWPTVNLQHLHANHHDPDNDFRAAAGPAYFAEDDYEGLEEGEHLSQRRLEMKKKMTR